MNNSSQKVVFHVFTREKNGTKAAKQLRAQGKTVGNIYGLGTESTGVYMDKHGAVKLYEGQGDTGLVYLQLDEKKKQIPVLIDGFETDPLGKTVQHITFRKVDLTEKLRTEVPLEMVGDVDITDSVVTLVRDSITVEALPADFPEKIEVDTASLQAIGDRIVLSDLNIDMSKISFEIGDEDPAEYTLVTVQEVKEEPEETEEIDMPEMGEVPATAQKNDATNTEGEAAEDAEKSE